MSRILRRPMFRGGGTVDSYGKGITAPLVPGYMGGGQIGGGIIYGKPMADGRFGFQAPVMFNAAEMTMPMSTNVKSGLELLARNKAINTGAVPFTSYNIPGVEKEKQGEKTIDDGKSKVIEDLDFSEMDTDLQPPTTDYEKIPKYIEDIDGDGISDLNPEYLENKNFFNEIFGGPFKKTGESFGKADKKGRVFEGMEGELIGDPREDLPDSKSTKIEDPKLPGENELEEGTQISAKDAIAENQKLFAELLGADKARGQDIGDMLLRFSGSGGNTLGEKFQNYVRAESAAGPSRSEKIKQTAAGLAINDYVAGKRSKEQAEVLKDKIDYEYGKKAALASIQDTDDVSTALAKMSKLTDSSFDSLKNIKALITNKTGRSDIYQGTIKIDDLKKQNKLNKLKPGYNIIEDEGIKRIVEIGKQGDNNVVISIQTIAELWTG